jgi:Tol biopolymer transport system component
LHSDLPAADQSLGVARSGAFYYSAGSNLRPRSRIYEASFDFAAGRFVSPTAEISSEYEHRSVAPSWSPDGSSLAYIIQRGPAANAEMAVAIRSLDTGAVRELHPHINLMFSARWSPDGRSLVAPGRDMQGRSGIFQIDAHTGNATALLLDKPNEQSMNPNWSADGKSVIFPRTYRGRSERSFIQLDLATRNEREIIRRANIGGANPSPDGRYIATVTGDAATNSRTLLLIPLAGGEPRELMRVASETTRESIFDPNEGVFLQNTTWAPDSRSVLVWKVSGKPDDRKSELWQVPLEAGQPRRIESKLLVGNSSFFVHPDGRRVAYSVADPNPPHIGEVWALENFLPSAK